LLARGGAEGVASSEQHALALTLEILGELADAGGFACAIDARDHQDERLVAADVERLFQRVDEFGQRGLERIFELARVFQPRQRHALAHVF